jgi:SAM-dependent methyltransferase
MQDAPRRVGLTPQDYDDRWIALAATGHDVHGEADLVADLLRTRSEGARASAPRRVLDAGCGTGRVAIELARRGFSTVGVDVDRALLARAGDKAPALAWVRGDLATLAPGEAPGPFDAIVLAGNVMIFVARGTESQVLANLAHRVGPGGIVVAGFQLTPGRITAAEYDDHAHAVGLEPLERWSTWDRGAFDERSGYAVLVHQRVDVENGR